MVNEEIEFDVHAEHRPRLTKRVLFVLCTISLIDCINCTILTPYVDAMVSSILNKPRGDPSLAMWVSMLVGSYSICEVLFSGFWGMLSDRIGRRPVLLIGLAGSVVAPILFGLAQSLPFALAARLLDGFFCGNASITRTYLGEIVDASNEARAFGYLALTYSFGLFIGPSLGGLLSEPATSFPAIFHGTIFDRHPYLLPNLAYAGFGLLALIVGACALEETRKVSRQLASSGRNLLLASSLIPGTLPERTKWSPRLILTVLAMTLLFGYTSARLQAFILVTALPRSLNGLSLGPKVMGYIQTCASLFTFFTQTVLYERGMKRYGPHRCFIGGLGLTVLLMLPFPAYCLVSDPVKFGLWRYVPVGLFQSFSQIGFTFAFPTSFLLVNRQCNPENRGAVNGWANSCSALSRGIFPFIVGALVDYGVGAEHSGLLGGRYIAFYVACFLGLVNMGVLSVLLPPSENPVAPRTVDLPKDVQIIEEERRELGA